MQMNRRQALATMGGAAAAARGMASIIIMSGRGAGAMLTSPATSCSLASR
jgi:hypothetical protein